MSDTIEEAPQVTTQMLIDAGINAFALMLLSESLAGKKDVRTFKRLRFEFRGVIYTLEPSIQAQPSDVSP